MKHDWEYKKVGDVCAPKKHILKASNCFEGNDNIQYIDISSIDNKSQRMTGVSNYIMSDAPSRAQQCVQKGDILVSTVRPNLKNIAVVDREDNNLVASSGFCVLRVTGIELNYLFHYITSEKFTNHLMNLTTGANYPAVRDSDILETIIPVPPLPTQQSIVSELDSLSQIIADCKETLKDYDALEQSIFYDMFGDPVKNEKGWELKKLEDCCLKIGSGATPKGGDSAYKEEGISLIRSLNVHNDGFRYKDLAFIDEDQAKALSNVQIEPLDVLLNITGASVARCCIVPNDVIPARVNQHVSILRCNQDVIAPTFLSFQLKSAEYQTVLLTISRSNGATREALTKQQQQNFDVILPPLPLQQQFASKIEAIEQMKSETKKALQEAETLFNARMDYWFN